MPLKGVRKQLNNKEAYLKRKTTAIDAEKAKEDFEKCAALDAEDKIATGEVETYTHLCRLFYGIKDGDVTSSWYKKKNKEQVIVPASLSILGKTVTLWEWLELRLNHRIDFWLFMHTTRGKWSEQGHKPLADFFGNKDNSMLGKDYTEDDLKEFVVAQGERPNGLLLYPHGFRKSTVNVLDCAHWIINSHGDIVILVITSTNPLGNKFVRLLRSIFEVKDYSNPSDIQRIFPEHTIPEGSGLQTSFSSPIRRLGLKDPTLTAKSMESSGFAGTRAHLLKFDDAVDEENWKTVDSRLKILAKYDAACELIESPFGHIHVIGTRWTSGRFDDYTDEEGTLQAIPDLYGVILNRETEAQPDDKSFKILIASAWTPKEHAVNKDLMELTEDDVDLLCPGKGPGSFVELRKKRDKKPNGRMNFECQQLNHPAMRSDETMFINHFDEPLITSLMTDISWVSHKLETGKIIIIWDTANSTRLGADFSAGICFFIEDVDDGDPIAWLLSCDYGRWTNSELARHIVAFHSKWGAQTTMIEELATTSDTFKDEIRREQIRQGVAPWIPYWFPPDSKPKAKENRIANLEPLMRSGRFKICQGDRTNCSLWIEELKKEFLQFTGHKSNKNAVGGRHDDLIDAAAYLYKIMPIGARTPEDKERDERMAEKIHRQRQYDTIHGFSPVSFQSLKEPQETTPSNPIYDALQILNSPQGPSLSFPRRPIGK